MQSIYSALHGLLNLILRPGFLLSLGLSLESLIPSFPLALSPGLSLLSLPSPWGQSQAHVVLREGLKDTGLVLLIRHKGGLGLVLRLGLWEHMQASTGCILLTITVTYM